MSEAITVLARVNLVAGLAIFAVLAFRPLVRRVFGAEVTYSLWTLPLAAVVGTIVPARVVIGAAPSTDLIGGEAATFLLVVWLTGAALVALLFGLLQARFLRLARRGQVGPAVVGVIAPRLLMPQDDGLYTPEERALVKAHEREHIERGDLKANAFLALAQCLAWFNPLVHVAAHVARMDQELACDACVMGKRGMARAAYARALLKTQMSGAVLPFGARWTPPGAHPLELRISLLTQPTRLETITGFLLVAGGAWLAAAIAWSAQPPSARAPDLYTELVGEGPPCPIAERLSTGPRRLPAFEYGGVRFTRKSGNVSCTAVSEIRGFSDRSYGVCQFHSSPLIGVATKDETVFYAPGAGQRATIQIRDGKASCTIGGWFAGEDAGTWRTANLRPMLDRR